MSLRPKSFLSGGGGFRQVNAKGMGQPHQAPARDAGLFDEAGQAVRLRDFGYLVLHESALDAALIGDPGPPSGTTVQPLVHGQPCEQVTRALLQQLGDLRHGQGAITGGDQVIGL